MKIGILTHPLEINYGAILQNYALQQVLKKMGHTPYTIDRHNDDLYLKQFILNPVFFVFSYIRKYILRKNNVLLYNKPLTQKQVISISTEIQSFINNNINKTKRISSNKKLKDSNSYNFDAVIVGSDQIWIPLYAPYSFLSFIDNEKTIKIAYAASFGDKYWNYDVKMTDECRNLVQSFSSISVREFSGISLCSKYLNVMAKQVLDPTFLLSASNYSELIKNDGYYDENSNFNMVYILDESDSKKKIYDKVAAKLNNKNEFFTLPKFSRDLKENKKKVKPIQMWIDAIMKSKFVITDSFHGTVFAIIFNKPFISIANHERGLDRFISLLSMFKLENRLVLDYNEDAIINLLQSVIDYDCVNKLLKHECDISNQFLVESLNTNK